MPRPQSSNPRTSVLLIGSMLVLAGGLLDGSTIRRATLRTVSSLSGRAAAGLRRLSIASGLAYVDLAYPPEPATEDAPNG